MPLKYYEITEGGDHIFTASGRDCFFQEIRMAGLVSPGVWFDPTTEVTQAELEPYYLSRGFTENDPLVLRMLRGFNSGRKMDLMLDFNLNLTLVDLAQLNWIENEHGRYDGSADAVVETNTKIDTWSDSVARSPGDFISFETFTAGNAKTEGAKAGAAGPLIALADWTEATDLEALWSVESFSRKFKNYSEKPADLIQDLLDFHGATKFIDLGTFSLESMKGFMTAQGVTTFVMNTNLWGGYGHCTIITPFDLSGRFKILLVERSTSDYQRGFNHMAGGVLHFGNAGTTDRLINFYHCNAVTPTAADLVSSLQVPVIGETKTNAIFALVPDLWGLDVGMTYTSNWYARSSGNVTNPTLNSTYAKRSQMAYNLTSVQTKLSNLAASIPIHTTATDSFVSAFLRFTSTGEGWGLSLANGFEDLEMDDPSIDISSIAASYPLLSCTPSRVSARVPSEVVLGLLDDVKTKDGITPAEVTKINGFQQDLVDNPCDYSCTFYSERLIAPAGSVIEGTKLWRTIKEYNQAKLTEDLGDGVTMTKAKAKLDKAYVDRKGYHAFCSSAVSDEKTDLEVSDNIVFRSTLLAAVVDVEDVGVTTPSYQVTYDGSTWIPTEEELQYIIVAKSPSFTGTTLNDIISHFGWDTDWMTDAENYVGAGYLTGSCLPSSPSVPWQYISTEQFLTNTGYPKINFSDEDSRARAIFAYKGIKSDGAEFFFGSFFPSNQ